MENGRSRAGDARDGGGGATPGTVAGANAKRRRGADRRGTIRRSDEHTRPPPWEEQRAQFLTRYLFWALGIAYFSFQPEPTPEVWADRTVLYAVFGLYALLVAAYFWHARRVLHAPQRWRLAMWTDLAAVSYAVIADPVVISPVYLVYIMIILGNGMRYGLHFFREAVLGSFVLGGLSLLLRYPDLRDVITLRTVFFALFGSIIVLYAFTLTRRIERARQGLEQERGIDVLTGLLNRRALNERAEELFKRIERSEQPLVVVFADVDRFKRVNDTHGHQTGDRVLAEIARLLQVSVRSTDVVSRYGGDEFVLLLPDTPLDGGMIAAQRLQRVFGEWAANQDVDLSLSIGLGQAPQHGRDLKTVLERVDQAMYQIKSKGGRGGILRVGEMDDVNDFEPLRARLRAFARARDWEQFHSPKNLSMALIVEAAELVEHFQWLTESQSARLDPKTFQAVEQEVADVFIYLVRLSDLLGIDLLDAAARKIALNEEKYPANEVRGKADKR